jgi:hypothetical protein
MLKQAGVHQFGTLDRLVYDGVPAIPGARPLVEVESVRDAISALYEFQDTQMTGTVFLALIGLIEERIVARLVTLSKDSSGTLGAIQRRLEASLRIASDHIQALDEIRERRNCLVHDHGIVGTKLVASIASASGSLRSMIPPDALGGKVTLDGSYLTYCQHELKRYSDVIG